MTFLQRTGQLWKVVLFGAALVLGCFATLFQGFLYAPLGKELAMQIAIGGMVLMVGSFAWAGLNIRCPKCQLKIFFYALRKQGFFSWFAWLLQQEDCPQCGDGGVGRPRAAGRNRQPKGLKRP